MHARACVHGIELCLYAYVNSRPTPVTKKRKRRFLAGSHDPTTCLHIHIVHIHNSLYTFHTHTHTYTYIHIHKHIIHTSYTLTPLVPQRVSQLRRVLHVPIHHDSKQLGNVKVALGCKEKSGHHCHHCHYCHHPSMASLSPSSSFPSAKSNYPPSRLRTRWCTGPVRWSPTSASCPDLWCPARAWSSRVLV